MDLNLYRKSIDRENEKEYEFGNRNKTTGNKMMQLNRLKIQKV
jgi:hypothetical protein